MSNFKDSKTKPARFAVRGCKCKWWYYNLFCSYLISGVWSFMTFKWSGLLIFYSFKVFAFINLNISDSLCNSIKGKLRVRGSIIFSRRNPSWVYHWMSVLQVCSWSLNEVVLLKFTKSTIQLIIKCRFF